MRLEQILQTAREVGWTRLGRGMEYPVLSDRLQRFTSAVLAWADVNSIHTCHDRCDRPGCVRVREAVAAEREACAKVCDAMSEDERCHRNFTAIHLAAAIRARGAA
jgi:hypothetical protein